MERTPWWAYVERQMDARGWSKADLSRAADIDQSVIGRWQNRAATPEPRTVRAVALALGRDVREAAIAAALFTAEELTTGDTPLVDPTTFDLSVISDERLRDEVYARMRRGHALARPPKPRLRRRDEGGPSGAVSISPASGHEIIDVARHDYPNGPVADLAAGSGPTVDRR